MIGTLGAIALGGGLGAAMRFGVNHAVTQILGNGFPWGVMIINILGSFLMGVAIVKFSHMDGGSQEFRSFVTTGFLGGFTTFSAFSLDFVTLWERGDLIQAFAYMMASVICSVLALFLALAVMRGFAA